MEKKLTVCFPLAIFLIIALAHGKGNFKSYNNEERQRFLQQNYHNEIDSLDLHEKPVMNSKQKDITVSEANPRWDPTWESIDSRPLPAW